MNTALRELERVAQEMRERRVNNGKSVSPTLIAWADRITSIIAALGEGQEAGAVAMPLNDDEHEWLMYAVDHMLDDSEPEDKTCARVLQGLLDRCVVTSPAHTSEARDATRLDFMVHLGAVIDCSYNNDKRTVYRAIAFGQSLTGWKSSYREAIDAAMRQEGGTP